MAVDQARIQKRFQELVRANKALEQRVEAHEDDKRIAVDAAVTAARTTAQTNDRDLRDQISNLKRELVRAEHDMQDLAQKLEADGGTTLLSRDEHQLRLEDSRQLVALATNQQEIASLVARQNELLSSFAERISARLPKKLRDRNQG